MMQEEFSKTSFYTDVFCLLFILRIFETFPLKSISIVNLIC